MIALCSMGYKGLFISVLMHMSTKFGYEIWSPKV